MTEVIVNRTVYCDYCDKELKSYFTKTTKNTMLGFPKKLLLCGECVKKVKP